MHVDESYSRFMPESSFAFTGITLPQLRSFCETARKGSMVAAARALRLSHPTIWKQVHTLEEFLGTKLLETFRRGCRPTAAGEELLALASPLIEGLDSLEPSFREAHERRNTTIQFGASPRTLVEEMPSFLVSFSKTHPHIHVVTHEVVDRSIVDLVSNKQLDLGISTVRAAPNALPPGISATLLYELDLLLLLPLKHALHRKKNLRLEDIPQHEILNDLSLFPSDSVASRLVALNPNSIPSKFKLTGAEIIRRYVRAELGIGIVGGLPGRQNDPTLVEVPLTKHLGTLPVHAVYRNSTLSRRAQDVFLTELQKAMLHSGKSKRQS
jgi:molybdate transport repressor ModE-like protein